MKTRFITGSLIAAVFLGVAILALCLHSMIFDIFVLALMLMAAMEMSRALGQKFAKPMEILTLLGAFFGYVTFFLLHYYDYGSLAILGFMSVLFLAFLAAVIWVSFSKNKTSQHVQTTSFVLVYPLSILVFMLALNYLDEPHRSTAIVLLFLVAPFTDVFAYLVGSKLKGPKLCPSISPKKTISGAIGGLLGGIMAGLIVFGMIASGGFEWLGLEPFAGTYLPHLLILGFLGSIFTQGGDLLASFVKRRVDIKDYGSLLPGHGGIMDRIDGMMLAAFLINFYMTGILLYA